MITEVLDLTESGSRSDVLTLVQILGQCQALVQQYRVMLEYYLLQYLAEIRVTGKLLSVLLAVFTELTSKVNIPPIYRHCDFIMFWCFYFLQIDLNAV